MPKARQDLAAGVINGILYAVGGDAYGARHDNQAYNPATNTWTTKALMPTGRYNYAASILGQRLYAVGGQTRSNFLNTVEAYDPATDTWTTKAPMPTARDGLATRVVGNTLYAVGGLNGGFLNLNEAFNPQ
jgi:N-acetylneuraminic acid mutarotase